MPDLHALLLTFVVASGSAAADPAAVRVAMDEALRAAAPLPSGRPVLPEGALPAGQLTDAARAMKRDAGQMAVERAKKSAGQEGHDVRGGAAHRGEASETMHGEHEGGDQGCDPAEMMRSRGQMPGQDHSMPDHGPQHHGM